MANNIKNITSARAFQNQEIKRDAEMSGSRGRYSATIPSNAAFALISSHGGSKYGRENVWVVLDAKMFISFYQENTAVIADLTYAKFGEAVEIGCWQTMRVSITVSGSTITMREYDTDYKPRIAFYR